MNWKTAAFGALLLSGAATSLGHAEMAHTQVMDLPPILTPAAPPRAHDVAPSVSAIYAKAAAVATPHDLFGPLYAEVETRGLFADNKAFADAVPRRSPAAILAAYRKGAPWSDARLKAFVETEFQMPTSPSPAAVTAKAPVPLDQHIAGLWPVLTRPGFQSVAGSSALSLPKAYVVPGGRFRELYYWDSYFTMLGLARDGRQALVESMIDDFGSLIDRYGHIPNGARTYYLSRSQPPFFFAMVGLSKATNPAVRARRLAWLRQEHAFWMAGEAGLKPGEARLHVVALPDGGVLNRYFDARQSPRDESYAQDVAVAHDAGRPVEATYRDLRAGAESGWDFSSRWLGDGRTLKTIHTTDLVPPDLNSLLYGLERAIADGCRQAGDGACAAAYAQRAEARAKAMRHWLWDDADGLFRDYDWRARRFTANASAATLYPLFTGVATPQQAVRVAAYARANLLAPGGLRTTATNTGQQWDQPNGWAPLQWIAVAGLKRYGQDALAGDVACRWLVTVQRSYGESGKLVEKYDVEHAKPGGGGEYPLQDGFGWTNGVTRALDGTRCPAS